MSEVEAELCALIEPVLARYGIPLRGLPLSPAGKSDMLAARGDADRGDMTSDIAAVVVDLFLSDVSVNGRRLSWRELYEHRYGEWLRDRELAAIAQNLDRCEHGRHEGDVCSDCGGPSLGNPLWRVGHTRRRREPADLASRPVDEVYERFWDRFGETAGWPERMVGFSLGGDPICVPERGRLHDPEAWTSQ